jgi:hypothetical protein
MFDLVRLIHRHGFSEIARAAFAVVLARLRALKKRRVAPRDDVPKDGSLFSSVVRSALRFPRPLRGARALERQPPARAAPDHQHRRGGLGRVARDAPRDREREPRDVGHDRRVGQAWMGRGVVVVRVRLGPHLGVARGERLQDPRRASRLHVQSVGGDALGDRDAGGIRERGHLDAPSRPRAPV